MVSSRLPQCFVALHSLETDENVLHSFIKCMSHMQLSGYVWRRHNNGKWFLIRVYFCMKISVVHPFLVKTFLDPFWIVGLCKFFAHDFPPKKSAPHTKYV